MADENKITEEAEEKDEKEDAEEKDEKEEAEEKDEKEEAVEYEFEFKDKGDETKVQVKRYWEEIYGEEFEGEDFFPPPSDFDMLMADSGKDQPVEPAATEEKSETRDEIEIFAASEVELKSEESLESVVGEDLEGKFEPESGKVSMTISSFDYGPRISEYFMQAKEKTPSELQFETDYREVVEERIKKIMHPMGTEGEREKKAEERAPIEKKRLLISEVDVSGLYPLPKVIESEVSFAFDEDEEGEKGHRGIQTEADIVLYIMDALRDSLKHDSESIFVRNIKEAIQKVKGVVEEIVTLARKGQSVDIQQKVNDSLPHFKANLRNTLIIRLKEKLERTESVMESEEEEEGKPVEAKKEGRKAKRKAKIKPVKRIEEVVEEEAEEVSEEEDIKEIVEALTSKFKIRRELTETEEEGKISYEKIDWEELLTESERQLSIDLALRSEMELYMRQRKKEVDEEQKMLAEKKYRKLKYEHVKEPLDRLKNANLNVTMKFILNTGDTFTCAYRYFMPFKEIKEDLSAIFKVPPDVLIVHRDEVEVEDHQTAFDLEPEIEPFQSVTFRLLTLDNDRWRLKSDHLDLPVPDIITFTVETGKNHLGVSEFKEVVVEIENRKIKKPFVGGYRDRVTGTEYHHAFSQSAPHPPKLQWEKRVSRDTQTAFTAQKVTDMTCEKSTQMARRDFFVCTEFDKIMTAKAYVDYDTWCKQRDVEGKVKTIQRYLRAMILRRFLKKMSHEYRKRKCWEMEQEKKRILERENRIKGDIINMTYPKTRADFDMLYALVEKWKKAQVQRISSLKTEAPKKAELCSVLEKEVKLLEAIEVHRIAVSKEQKRIKTLNFMEKVAKPVTWTGYRGMTIKMDTLKTQRARELKELYQSLSQHDLGYQDRIELLISLKYALRMQWSRLADELTELINQECEMLIRGAKSKDLDYLRQRIQHLFTEYFKDPNFNPEAAKYDPTYDKEPIKNNVLFCKSCSQMKLLKEFSATSRDRSVDICSSCQWLHNIAVPRVDLSPYRYILRTVRRDEQKRNCYTSCAFILQDEDMRFLVQNIWRNRSAVSEHDNLIDLRLPRWNKNTDWTPWNCILLTETETKAHLKTKPEDNYEPQLMGEIVSKHEMAKRHFRQLFSTATRLNDSGKWANVVDVKEFEAPPLTADLWDLKQEEMLKLKKEGVLYKVQETRRKEVGYVQQI